MNSLSRRIYRLDGIEIDTAQVCLKRNGQELHVRQKTFQVLIYLLEQRPRLVTKNELIERIWQGTAVTDNALEQCLAEIRKVLGDDSRQPRFIKTVPRGGYRFIGSVRELDSEEESSVAIKEVAKREAPDKDATRQVSEATINGVAIPATKSQQRIAWRWVAVSTIVILIATTAASFYFVRRRSLPDPRVTLPQETGKNAVAVMFFDNQSASADLDWLREGLADMIITDLSRSKNLTVLSRQQLQVLLGRAGHRASEKIELDEALDVARKSQAKIVILGSFARMGEQVRIDARLHDARDGQLLAAERLVVDQPAQILTQVDLLSLKLASHLGGPAERETNTSLASVMTHNLEAYRYYSLGVEKAQLLRSEEALALFDKAVALDPNFAMAYARIGYVYGVTGNSPEKAKPYLERAFQLTDRLTEKDKLQIQAWYAVVNYDYAAAIDAFRHIIGAYPLEVEASLRLAHLLRGEDKSQEAIEVLKQGLVIDSGYKDFYNDLGFTYSEMGRHDEAIAMFQRYVQLAPEEPNSHDSLGLGYQWAGRYDEAIQEYERALQLKPDFEIAIVHLANTYFQLGRYSAATDEYQRYVKVPTSVRSRGYAYLAHVELKKHNLSQAERLARLAGKGGYSYLYLYLVALERNDLQTARNLKEEIEQGGNERGLRNSQRPLWYARGLYALKSGSAEEAINDFKQALNYRPQTWSIDAYEDCLANAYLELGRFDEAIAEYERILKLNPNYPLVHYHLGQAFERKGQNIQARPEYERFLQVWKDADAGVPEIVMAKQALSG